MTEYIEREAFKEVLTRYLNAPHVQMRNSVGQSMQIAIKSCIEFLDNEYAADVAPVVHGRWEQCFEDWRQQIEGDKCSVCGFEHYGASIKKYKYCPNCGTLMDLEG